MKAVETLDAIIRDAEMLPPLAVASVARLMHAEHGRALCEAAVTLADRGQADAIVAVTREGNTARMLAALRPNAPIFAATNRVEVARRLMLYRGVVPIVTTIAENVDATGALNRQTPAGARAREAGRAKWCSSACTATPHNPPRTS